MLSFDQQINLVNRGLARMKNDGKFTTFKYHRRAMYDYLWFVDTDLMECRGHVYDSVTKELVQAAPRKSFNYLENDYWWKDVPLDTLVDVYKKINGYMACATLHNNELVVSTTGSTTSEHAKWAKELILNEWWKHSPNIEHEYTTLFEVVVPQDPHIVKEKMGLHLLGFRNKETGVFSPHNILARCTLSEIIEFAQDDRGEGFMIYLASDTTRLAPCKLKTPYYIGKKKLMRMSAKNVEIMFDNPYGTGKTLPTGWYHFPDRIWNTVYKDDWLSYSDQERRAVLEEIEGK